MEVSVETTTSGKDAAGDGSDVIEGCFFVSESSLSTWVIFLDDTDRDDESDAPGAASSASLILNAEL